MNLVEKAVSFGGTLAPLVIPETVGAMNPSIFTDQDGDILVNVRVVNYTLYHSENQQRFPSRWGPLSYLHPEQDIRLATDNHIVRLNNKLEIVNHTQVEMLQLHQPSWEFHGLEDARLVQWNNQYSLIGVRRDVDTIGTGRMEYTHIDLNKKKWTATETHRVRIPAPEPDNSYCEKNWYPINDKPHHFVKWTNPTEIVYANPNKPECTQISLHGDMRPIPDQRGSSQLIPYHGVYLCITHEVDLFKNYLNQKDAIYRHRLVVWDKAFNVIGYSQPFSFLDGRVEFCVGATVNNDDLLISFSFQDNAAFVLRTPHAVVEDMILEAL